MNRNNYYKTNELTLDLSGEDPDAAVTQKYNQGYLFGRINKGYMYQTRALRINLEGFEFNSENRRVLRKTEGLEMSIVDLPVKLDDYNWQIHKLGKDFYSNKFGDGTFSASKIKKLLTSTEDSHFTDLLQFSIESRAIGYCILYKNDSILHYCYPFYDFENLPGNTGMGMMLRAIQYSVSSGLDYIYLGSVTKPSDKYKLQFNNLEWFDGTDWQRDIDEIKQIIN